MELPAGFINVGFQLCVGDLLLSMLCNDFGCSSISSFKWWNLFLIILIKNHPFLVQESYYWSCKGIIIHQILITLFWLEGLAFHFHETVSGTAKRNVLHLNVIGLA